MGHAFDCSATDPDDQPGNLIMSESIEDCISESCIASLIDSNIDAMIHNSLEDINDAQEVSPECSQQIAETMKSFLFVIYDCTIERDERICIGTLADFITNLYFLNVYCQGEFPPEEENGS
jgi:hypothetical protein